MLLITKILLKKVSFKSNNTLTINAYFLEFNKCKFQSIMVDTWWMPEYMIKIKLQI